MPTLGHVIQQSLTTCSSGKGGYPQIYIICIIQYQQPLANALIAEKCLDQFYSIGAFICTAWNM